MTLTETTFLVFPAFLIGSAIGVLIALALRPGHVRRVAKRPVLLAVSGSAAGAMIYLLTPERWPFIAGPFILTVFLGIGGALIGLYTRPSLTKQDRHGPV